MTKTAATQNCHDCGAAPGALHEYGCDVEVCPFCGHQMIGCTCHYEPFYPEVARGGEDALPPEVQEHGLSDEQFARWLVILGEKGRIPWTGEWPGTAECRELGWFVCFDGGRWIPCTEDHPRAVADTTRLKFEGRWDSAAKRWVVS